MIIEKSYSENSIVGSLFSAYSLLISFAYLALCYVVLRVIFPGKKGGIPSMSWLDLFQFPRLSLLPFPKYIEKVLRTGKKAGCKAVYAPTPEGLKLILWDPDYADYVDKNPERFPSYLRPRSESGDYMMDTTSRFGTREEWNATMTCLT